MRDGVVLARRLVRPSGGLVPPGGGVPWRLEIAESGSLDQLGLVPCPQVAGPLGAGRVRVAVRAAAVEAGGELAGLGEAEAFRRLQRLSTDRCQPMKQTALQVLAADGIFPEKCPAGPGTFRSVPML